MAQGEGEADGGVAFVGQQVGTEMDVLSFLAVVLAIPKVAVAGIGQGVYHHGVAHKEVDMGNAIAHVMGAQRIDIDAGGGVAVAVVGVDAAGADGVGDGEMISGMDR